MFLLAWLSVASAAPESLWGGRTQEWLQESVDQLDEPSRLPLADDSSIYGVFSGASQVGFNVVVATIRQTQEGAAGVSLSASTFSGGQVMGPGPAALTDGHDLELGLTAAYGHGSGTKGWGLGVDARFAYGSQPYTGSSLLGDRANGFFQSLTYDNRRESTELSVELNGGLTWRPAETQLSFHPFVAYRRALAVNTSFDGAGDLNDPIYGAEEAVNHQLVVAGFRSEARREGGLLTRGSAEVGYGGPAAGQGVFDDPTADELEGSFFRFYGDLLIGSDVRLNRLKLFVGFYGDLSVQSTRYTVFSDGTEGVTDKALGVGGGVYVPFHLDVEVHPKVSVRMISWLGLVSGTEEIGVLQPGQEEQTANGLSWDVRANASGGVRWLAHEKVELNALVGVISPLYSSGISNMGVGLPNPQLDVGIAATLHL